MINDLSRTFFHETRHFVAHEINHRYHEGFRTRSIELFDHPQLVDFWKGEAHIELPAGLQSEYIQSFESLAGYLATLAYGCIFESYHLGTDIELCFKTNGKRDARQWDGILRRYNLVDLNNDITDCERIFFVRLKETEALKGFMTLVAAEFLIPAHTADTIDVQKLRETTPDLIEAQAGLFGELVPEYQHIINPNACPENEKS